MRVCDFHTIAYDDARALQRRTASDLQSGTGEEVLYLLEHPHVITVGRNATNGSLVASKELLARRGVTLAETDRGGDITYHGPGQLVGYPIILLEEDRRDIRRYVHDLEETLILTLADYGILGRRDAANRGVWVGDRKIASVGIRISRWVTSHGFALNVHTDLDYFKLIVPCGIQGCEMTSISRELARPVGVDEVKRSFVRHFETVYGRTAVWDEDTEEVTSLG